MLTPEILAPGGGFNSSIHAFEAGADAVYVGMKSFSARKGASNFTLESLRSLKGYAVKNNKKIFVAINTVIKNDELPELITLLHKLVLIEIEAVILQDIGLAHIIRTFFPQIVMHGSTQMAVHNSEGIQELKKLGFSRIILARELTLKEIKVLREKHMDIELEVFIHGALCNGFSGICLASGVLLGRSGNRGECGQICRTWFDGEDGHKFSFSTNDFNSGSLILELQKIGIDSFKIEGRLKSPEYVFHTVSYYKSIINGDSRKIIDKENQLSAISFSRNQTTAFLTNPKGIDLINNKYPSHTGIIAGKVVTSEKNSFMLKSEVCLSDRDGILILDKNGNHQFALKSSGNRSEYRPGDSIRVVYSKKIKPGSQAYKVSGHDLQLKEYRETSWKPWKSPLVVHIEIQTQHIILKTTMFNRTITYRHEISVEPSKSGKSILEILNKNISKSGTSSFYIEEIILVNRSDFDETGIFIPLSQVKEVKNSFFNKIDEELETIVNESGTSILSSISRELGELKSPVQDIEIPSRKNMNPENGLVPFYDSDSLTHFSTEESKKQSLYIPLNPLHFNSMDFNETVKHLEKIISGNKYKTIVIGLNNVSHLSLIEIFRDKTNVFFFTDYCLYIANEAAELFYKKNIQNLLFSYYWIEDKKGSLNKLRKIEDSFSPHLFISRICYRKHNNLGGCDKCKKDYKYSLMQRDKAFTVIVRGCISWLFKT